MRVVVTHRKIFSRGVAMWHPCIVRDCKDGGRHPGHRSTDLDDKVSCLRLVTRAKSGRKTPSVNRRERLDREGKTVNVALPRRSRGRIDKVVKACE